MRDSAGSIPARLAPPAARSDACGRRPAPEGAARRRNRLPGGQPARQQAVGGEGAALVGIPVKWKSVSGDLEHGFRRSGTLVGA